MAAFSVYLEDKILDLTLNGVAFAPTGSIYVALFTDGNGLNDNAPTAEVTNTGYGRQLIDIGSGVEFTLSSLGVSSTNAPVVFGPATENWTAVTHIALMDAITGGNVYYWGALPASKLVLDTESFTLATGELKVALT